MLGACHECAAGMWSDVVGSTLASDCRKCPAGTWNPVAGVASQDLCQKCTPGYWSDQEGASSQTTCSQCPTGTWSATIGAHSEDSCLECPAGRYQPALGQANNTNCIQCAPGTYTSVTGLSACFACPAGTWMDDFDARACNICPEGTWSFQQSTRLGRECVRCSSAYPCGGDISARVTWKVFHMDALRLTEEELAGLAVVFTQTLAATCSVGAETIRDLYGDRRTVSVNALADGSLGVSAFVMVPASSSATALARRLYNQSFCDEVDNATITVVGLASEAVTRHATCGNVVIQPEQFHAMVHPATSTTVSSTTVTDTTGAATTTGATTTTRSAFRTSVHQDMVASTHFGREPSETGAAAGRCGWGPAILCSAVALALATQ